MIHRSCCNTTRLIWPFLGVVAAAGIALSLVSCASNGGGNNAQHEASTAKIQAVNLSDLVAPAPHDLPVTLAAAKNEWTSFEVQVSGLLAPTDKVAYTLRIQPLNLQSKNSSIGVENFSAYQILSMPVDVNRAGYVRHTGLSAATRLLPRALLPMQLNDGRMNLSGAPRDPNKPADPNSHAGTTPVMLWIDLHIPPEAPAGAYSAVCEILQSGIDKPVASVPINLNVYDFVLPDERHLNLVGQIDWESLQRLYPDRFEAVTPRLLNRKDDKYKPAIKTLDQLVTMAQAHRVEVVIPHLQPSVKWPPGKPPVVRWDDFDTVVSPWLKGDMFADKVPLGYWPLPAAEGLFNFDPKSQREYWADAATHFDQNDWLVRSPVFMESKPGRASALDSLIISGEAANLLNAHPRIRVAIPLEDDQIQFAGAGNPNLIQPQHTPRLITSNPGIVFSSPIQNWPMGVTRPQRWMRTDLTGLIPYVGAGGDERDVRLWAWLSYLPLPPPNLGIQYGPVQFIRWLGALPKNSNANQPADPNELIWFYPGSWFGIDQPVPTIQLKWLRRAQQDYEYLYLARQRGDVINALYMARLMTKPVELQADQQPDPTFGLMCGTADPKAWEQATDLLAKRILLHEPGQTVDKDKDFKLNIETLQWSYPQERPVIMGRSTQWGWENVANQFWISLQLGIDVYNASDSTPDENSLAWTSVPELTGWQVKPQALPIPALATYHVRRYSIDARVDPSKIKKVDRRPVEITFTNGFTKKTSKLRMILPVAASDRREGMLDLNGSLDDWSPDDAIQDGPMIRMFNRPALQAQELQPATTPAQVYTGWADQNFYLAFKVTGLSQSPIKTVKNFVSYQFRRAWGEDLCQLLIQPIYADSSVGPILHVVCKPSGNWVERKLDPRRFADPWQAFEGAGVRYVATLDGADWRGEVAIPWKAINGDENNKKGMPVMLRFNFTQHRQDTGESSSWAGPVDFGRDDSFTGILVLREPDVPGMARTSGE
jgi:hypothetical protein